MIGCCIVIVAIQFVTLQTVDGRDVHVNPEHIISIGKTREAGKGAFVGDVQCVITFVDGKFITVAETCDSVRRRVEDMKQ